MSAERLAEMRKRQQARRQPLIKRWAAKAQQVSNQKAEEQRIINEPLPAPLQAIVDFWRGRTSEMQWAVCG